MKIRSSEITPKATYLSRKEFIKGTAIVGGSAFLAACGISPENQDQNDLLSEENSSPSNISVTTGADELGNETTAYESITNYNNFYEFNLNKEKVAKDSRNFITSPWQVEVGGLVNNPMTFGLEDLLKFETEERIYRLRCVEGWSMVIPWNGFSLSKILNLVEPKSEAKYVRFETIYDPEQMPGQNSKWYEWPYIEGLRIDEAMNDLVTLATGIYGEDLKPQNGAPIRLVVPWKYGFKSIKSIVRIDLVDTMPTSLWMAAAPNEYGFYANVNPDVDHPRWSQSSERRIGDLSRTETLKFNGYESQVAHLYDGMDLRSNF